MNGARGRPRSSLPAACLLVTAGLPSPSPSSEPLHVWQEMRRLAPEVSFERLQGGRVQLRDLRDRLVLLDFWTTWCAPCVEELPALRAFQHWARSRRDVVFLSVNEDGNAEALARFLRQQRPAFPVLLAGPGDPLAISGYPTKVFVDARGLLRLRRWGGPVPFEELRSRAVSLLKE